MSIDNNIDFKDHIVEYPNRFKMTNVSPGVVELVPTWIETPEQIIQDGTPVNEDLFEKLRNNVTCYSQTYTATEGQTLFPVSHPYNVGQSRISVYVGGVKQRTIVDFTEASSTSFILKEGLKAGTKVESITISFVQPLANDIQQQVDNLIKSYTLNQTELNLARTESIQMNRIPENSVSASKLKNSTNSDRIKLANLSDEVLQAMVGSTSINVTPGTESVSTEKIANSAITPEKTVMFQIGKNLFDKSTILAGYIVNQTNGNLQVSASYNASDFIPVIPGQQYTRNFSHSLAWYNESKTFISGQASETVASVTTTIVAPVNARYVRVTAPLISSTPINLNVFQLEKGVTATPYETYGFSVLEKYNKFTKVKNENLVDKAVTKEKVDSSIMTLDIKNLFNKLTATDGYIVNNSNGNLQASANYAASDFIPVTPGQQYTRNFSSYMAWYNENKTYVSGVGTESNVNTTTTLTAPANAYFMRVTTPREVSTPINLSMFQVEKGTVATPYESYGYRLPNNRDGIPVIYPSSNPWKGKVADCLGDSITAMNMWQPFVKDILELLAFSNHGIGGTRVSGSATDAMHQDARINALSSAADLITVMGGTNDWVQNVPLGIFGRSNVDTATFYGAANVMFKKLITRFPDKRILCMGTPYGTYPGRVGFTDTTGVINNEGLMTIDYGKALMKVARLHGIPCVDIGGEAGWNDQNVTTYITNDGALLHPNTIGGKRIGNLVANKLKNISL